MAAENSSPLGQDESWADKDAFVSYSTKDRAWVVDELLPALKANGISYTIDFEHFPAGMQLDAGIAVAAQRAAKTIAILTQRMQQRSSRLEPARTRSVAGGLRPRLPTPLRYDS